MPDGRTHSQTLKDSATQLLTKYKSGALVTQLSLAAIATVIQDFKKRRFFPFFHIYNDY